MNALMNSDQADMLRAEIPQQMREAKRWLLWKSEPQPGGKKPRKTPYYIDGTHRRGKLDTQADWSRLGTFDEAIVAAGEGQYAGLGFALGPDGSGWNWQGIDLDGVDGNDQLQTLKGMLPGYVEVSPSGHGIHAIGYGLPFASIGSNVTGIEAYSGGRYFTVTGESIGGDLEDLSGFVNETLRPLRDERKPRRNAEADRVTTVETDAALVADLRSALFHLRADERDVWVRMGMALKTLGDTGRGLWLDWSATSEKFDAADAARVWESFKGQGITHKTVFSEAQSAGWINPKTNVVKMEQRKPQQKSQPDAQVVRAPRDDWSDQLIVRVRDDGTEKVLCRVHNLILILQNAPEWAGRIELNEFSARIAVDRKDIDDVGPIAVKAKMERDWIPEKVPTGDVLDALSYVASQSPYHPVREYLDGIKWDGTPRIEHFFEDFCGCPRDDYHMAVANSLFVSAVARIYKPGCKVDTMVILESAQGMGKTKLWLTLFGDWCAEVTASLNDKDFYEGLRGVWAADFSELDAFSRAETTQIKRILTSQSDSYRPPYGRSTKTFPRQCVFVGGTNRDDWNSDPTGARRFLPVRVQTAINTDAVEAVRDQLWAEAKSRFDQGVTWWEIPGACEKQEDSYVGDTWEEMINQWLIARYQDVRAPSEPFAFLLGTVLEEALRIERGKQTRSDQTRAGNAMRRLGWRAKQEALSDGSRARVYRPKEAWLKEREKTMS